MKAIFCPDDIQLDEQVLEMMDEQIYHQLFDFIGDTERESVWFDAAIEARARNQAVNINEWFSDYFEDKDIELRGAEDKQVETAIEWTMPSEVNN
jgi:UDP-3-O-acyl-N-acetylglucosamine deacetylase